MSRVVRRTYSVSDVGAQRCPLTMIEGWLYRVISQDNSSLGLEYIQNAGVDINNNALFDSDSRGHLEVLVDRTGPSCDLALCQRFDQDLRTKVKQE